MAEGSFPKASGEILYASEINAIHKNIHEIYTGTAFNTTATQSGTSGTTTDEHSYEFSEIVFPLQTMPKYIRIKVLANITAEANGSSDYGISQIKIQTKEDGGSYSDKLPYTTIAGATPYKNSGTHMFEYLYTPTANEITNGLFIKIFSLSQAYRTSGTATATFTNIQTVIELVTGV